MLPTIQDKTGQRLSSETMLERKGIRSENQWHFIYSPTINQELNNDLSPVWTQTILLTPSEVIDWRDRINSPRHRLLINVQALGTPGTMGHVFINQCSQTLIDVYGQRCLCWALLVCSNYIMFFHSAFVSCGRCLSVVSLAETGAN